MFCLAREGTLTLPHTQVDYITFGRGEKPLVMIQGLNTRGIRGAGQSLAWMYRIFAADHTVYLFDRRAAVDPGITIKDLALDTAAAMDTLGLKNAHILGVSQGGMIAQYLAVHRPDLVDKLVLAVTLGRTNSAVTEAIHTWVRLTEEGHMKELVADMAERMYSPAYLRRYRPLLPLLTLLQKPKDVPRFTALARACLTCNTWDDLDKVTCPVLVIGGGQDRIVTGEASKELAARLNCPLHMYENLGHAAYEEAKDFNRIVADFFRN